MCVPAKWQLASSNGFSRVREYGRRTDHSTVTFVAIAGRNVLILRATYSAGMEFDRV